MNEAIQSQRLTFEFIDIGKVGEWGVPIEDCKKSLFPNYSTQVFDSHKNFDIVFIDGRFRLACLAQTLLHCSKDTKILMHDFNNRAFYHQILEFVDIVDTCDTLAEFKIKKDIDKQRLLEFYNEYKYTME